jgi:hypothetical protein
MTSGRLDPYRTGKTSLVDRSEMYNPSYELYFDTGFV